MQENNDTINGWIEVNKSFYMTFDGKRCYCNIPELCLNTRAARMLVRYKQGDEEAYRLSSVDGIRYSGRMGTDDDSRVVFDNWTCGSNVILAGSWKSGGHEGEWYIEGTKRAVGNDR